MGYGLCNMLFISHLLPLISLSMLLLGLAREMEAPNNGIRRVALCLGSRRRSLLIPSGSEIIVGLPGR